MTALPTTGYYVGSGRFGGAPAPTETLRPTTSSRPSIQSLEGRVRRYNSDIDPRSATFKAAVLLLAAADYGQNIDILTRRTGFERSFVAKCARRLIDNGVWVSGQMVIDWSPDDEASGAFWNDVAVAEGKMCRRVDAQGQIEWAPAGYWTKSYEFIQPAGEQSLSTQYRDPAMAGVPEGEAEGEGAAVAEGMGAEVVNEGEGTGAPPTVEHHAPAPDPRAPAQDAPESAASAEDVGQAQSQKDELFPGTVWLR